jgi:hypothetical protein
MRRSRNVTKLVYVYAWRRVSAPLSPEAAIDVDIDDHRAQPITVSDRPFVPIPRVCT